MGPSVFEVAVVDVLLHCWSGPLRVGLAIESPVAEQTIHSSACFRDHVVADTFPLSLLELAPQLKAVWSRDLALTVLLPVLVVTFILCAILPAEDACTIPNRLLEVAHIGTFTRVYSSAHAFMLAIYPVAFIRRPIGPRRLAIPVRVVLFEMAHIGAADLWSGGDPWPRHQVWVFAA